MWWNVLEIRAEQRYCLICSNRCARTHALNRYITCGKEIENEWQTREGFLPSSNHKINKFLTMLDKIKRWLLFKARCSNWRHTVSHTHMTRKPVAPPSRRSASEPQFRWLYLVLVCSLCSSLIILPYSSDSRLWVCSDTKWSNVSTSNADTSRTWFPICCGGHDSMQNYVEHKIIYDLIMTLINYHISTNRADSR